jgi:hypothetical protein
MFPLTAQPSKTKPLCKQFATEPAHMVPAASSLIPPRPLRASKLNHTLDPSVTIAKSWVIPPTYVALACLSWRAPLLCPLCHCSQPRIQAWIPRPLQRYLPSATFRPPSSLLCLLCLPARDSRNG